MSNQRKIQSWLPLLLSAVMVAGIALGFKIYEELYNPDSYRFNWYNQETILNWPDSNQEGLDSATKSLFMEFKLSGLDDVQKLIKARYIDSLSEDSLQGDAIAAMVRKLDPHSQYIPPIKSSEVKADLSGNFSGIGVEYLIIKDTVIIVGIIPKGPAAQAQLQEGDAILAINDSVVIGKKLNNSQLRQMLRGSKDSKVRLRIARNNEIITRELIRGTIPQPSLDAAYMLAPQVGYIRLNRFAETTYKEFMEATDSLLIKGMKKMILDLRGNGGGILEEAVKIGDEFLPEGKIIVSIEGRSIKNEVFRTTKPGLFETGTLVVLIDEQSASASEVLAAALQENDRALLVGRRSYGKGLIQEQYSLANGGFLRLTVARYLTPLGRNIQKPFEKNNLAYQHEIYNRLLRDSGINKQIDTAGKKYFTTPKGKKVYETGGLLPDVAVALDSTRVPADLVPIFSSPLLLETGYLIYHSKKELISKYAGPMDFYQKYTFDELDKSLITKLINSQSTKASKPLKPASLVLLHNRLKAVIARYKWKNNAFYEIINQNDPVIKKAIQQL
jgi:carboxyl-terminal processing protease